MRLPKAYVPSEYESDVYALWEKSRAFVPENRGNDVNFSMVFPLPNANGNLHLGHALTNAIYDIVIRYQRLQGKAALYLPGADHAGFETQVVYEKQLAKEGKSRFDFSRDELYQQIWDFVQLNKSNFENQFRKLGASCDWDHYTYTLDSKIIDRAYKTFKKLWDDGLVYRGERLVNYCTFHGTGFADIEVEYREEKGKLWHVRYPLTDGSGGLIIATTRPETMFGDVAVAVHPDDKRYKKFVGKTVKLPLTEREIPVITDEFVDQKFGTGAVKITPAHDQNDFEVGERHDLPKVTVIDYEGKMTEVPEGYRGLTVDEARKQVVRDLEEQGVIEKTETYTHSVGHCYKCGTVIQPLLLDQWFVDMQPLAKRAIKSLEAKEITFHPDSKRVQLISYLNNLKDWNISRQIAWGIPIPAFQNIDNPDDWIYDEHVDQEFIEVNGKTYKRDPDVFDTWFSSSSWPYATLDYPDSEDFKRFYPTSLLDTGGEILYPWVSRMIMLGLYVTDAIPFKEVYIHGYVMAEDGSKMSKSLGNVIDPLPVIEQYGSDALRMGIIAGRAPAVNRGYDSRKVEEARNFCNKLWNVARFIEHTVGENYTPASPQANSVADHWMLSKLQHITNTLSDYLEQYRFSEAYDELYHFVWDDFADWYIEASKSAPNKDLLAYVLESTLTLAHPFAPFVTETIWQALNWRDNLLATYHWPTPPRADSAAAQDFEDIRTIVSEARFIMNAMKSKDVTLYHKNIQLLADNAGLIARLGKLQGVEAATSREGLRLTQTKYDAWLGIDAKTAKVYLDELADKKAAQEQVIMQLEKRLKNKAYVKNAPAHIVEQTKAQLEVAQTLLSSIEQESERFNV